MRSDLSAFHRVDDLEAMPAPRFFSLATRLPHYQGAVRAAALIQREDGSYAEPADTRGRPSASSYAAPAVDPNALLHQAGSGWENAPGVVPAFAHGMPTAADLGLPTE